MFQSVHGRFLQAAMKKARKSGAGAFPSFGVVLDGKSSGAPQPAGAACSVIHHAK